VNGVNDRDRVILAILGRLNYAVFVAPVDLVDEVSRVVDACFDTPVHPVERLVDRIYLLFQVVQ